MCAPHSDGKKKPIILQAGHHARAKTDAPLIGILTQPLPEEWATHSELSEHIKKMNINKESDATSGRQPSFFEASHAEFLMAGGARVVAVDFQMDEKALYAELEQLNGIYIPGDCS